MTTNKEIVKFILFVLTYNKISCGTRYVLMSLMEYQTMFKQEDGFKVYPSYFKDKFDIQSEKLKQVLNYLGTHNWISYVENDKYYEVTVNYDKIEKVRLYEIENSRKK